MGFALALSGAQEYDLLSRASDQHAGAPGDSERQARLQGAYPC